MSSIHEAIYKDTRRGKGPMPNFVALTSHQERQGDTTNDDFHQRLQERRAEERQKRQAEGGRAGGYFDRQDRANKDVASTSNGEADEKYDEFGRRKAKPGDLPGGSKSARAQAALERLRQNALGKAAEAKRVKDAQDARDGQSGAGAAAAASGRRGASRSRDRSRSRQRGDRRSGR